MQQKFLVLLCFIFYLCTGVSGRCKKEVTKSTSTIFYADIYCFEVTSTTVFDYNFKNEDYPQDLHIDPETSKIEILHSNSSLSRFAGVYSLYLRNVGLKVIYPGVFEKFNTTSKIDLSSNNLKKISNGTFNNLWHLRELILSQNSIETIEEDGFSGLVHLETLNLRRNKISELNGNVLKNLPPLSKLDLSHNHIKKIINGKSIDFEDGGRLNLAYNNLDAIDFADFPHNIRALHLSHNNISSVKNWEELRVSSLVMDHNNLTEIEITVTMKKLQCSNNKISKIINKPSNTTKQLWSLNLAENEISDIDSSWFKDLPDLRNINLKNNKIKILHENTFQDCPDLSEIYLSNNSIEAIEANAFKNLRIIIPLDLSHNKLTNFKLDCLPDFFSVTLYLDGNEVNCTDIETLANNTKVRLRNINNFGCANVVSKKEDLDLFSSYFL